MIDGTNCITDYNRYLSRNIRQTIDSMSNDRKRRILDDIQLKRRCYNLMGQNYDTEACQYIESLLTATRRPNNV